MSVIVWDMNVQAYMTVHWGSRGSCENYIKTRKLVGDRRTFLLRPATFINEPLY
jgi:hypothetical protein